MIYGDLIQEVEIASLGFFFPLKHSKLPFNESFSFFQYCLS